MYSRIAVAASICFGTVWFLGCNVNPDEQPVACETRPTDPPPADPVIEITEQLFLLREGTEDLMPNPVAVAGMHTKHVEEFIRWPGLGIVRFRETTVGSQSIWVELVPESRGDVRPVPDSEVSAPVDYDDLTETVTRPDGATQRVRERAWRATDWNLMSVNAGSGPAVYTKNADREELLISAHDRMRAKPADGATAPKRPLDAFETAELANLRAGAEVVARSQGATMRVLGAIRARQECLACHKVDVGTMLGAFTYTLQLQSEAMPEADRLTDLVGLTDTEDEAVRIVESRGGKVVREPGGPVIELQLTFARTREIRSNSGRTTRLPLHDSALTIVEAFPQIRVLDVSHSLVTDTGLKALSGLKHLKRLDLTGTSVSDEGVAALQKDLPACEIVYPGDDRP